MIIDKSINNDKAGKELWDQYWGDGDLPVPLEPHKPGFRNSKNRRYHEYFSRIFSGLETKGLKLLEIGCARSEMLPYFAKEFDFNIYGIDYSEIGCEQSRKVLSIAGIDGTIICTDIFSPPESLVNTFDVIVSFGVVEHFEDTVTCLSAFSKLIKPNGIIVTMIPNLNGLNSTLFKMINRPIFNTHIILDRIKLLNAHEKANFTSISCDYFITVDFCIPNLVGLDQNSPLTEFKKFVRSNLVRLGMLIWLIEEYLGYFKATRFLSPYIIYTGIKNSQSNSANCL